MSRGHIEPLVGIARIGGAYGEPWTWAAVLRYDGPDTVTVEAVERAPTPHEWRDALAVMAAQGIQRARFVRRRADGSVDAHEVRTARAAHKEQTMKSIITHTILNENGTIFSQTQHENHNLTKDEAIAFRGYVAANTLKALEAYAPIAAAAKAGTATVTAQAK